MAEAFIVDGTRTPFGKFGGALSSVRADNLAAHPIRALMARHNGLPWAEVDDVIYGCANQAGEDNRNVARMAVLFGWPADRSARRNGQPTLRIRARGRGASCACYQGGRG